MSLGVKVWHRWIATFLTIVFTFFDLFQHVPATYAYSHEVIDLPSDAVSIPAALGEIQDSSKGTTDKTVIYIQDAHDSLEAQENIAKLIRYLVEHEHVQTVFEEGYEGSVPTDKFFGFIKDPKVKEKVSYFLLDKLRIGGAEYAHINRTKDFKLVGVDDLKLYRENILWYQEAAKNRNIPQEDLDELLNHIFQLANEFFPKDLKIWLGIKKRFSDEKLPLLNYLSQIRALYSNLVPQNQFKEQFPLISILFEARYSKDKRLLKRLNSVDSQSIFKEIFRLENEFSKLLLKNERDRKIFSYYQGLNLLRKLNQVELSQSEFEAAKEMLEQLQTEDLARFIVSLTQKPLAVSKEWERHIQNSIQFYEAAQKRDRAVESHLKDFIQNPNENIAVLVFGGFHKTEIEELLRLQGVSFLTVSPKISSSDKKHQNFYKELMSVGHYPFESALSLAKAARPESTFILADTFGENPVQRELFSIASVAQRFGDRYEVSILNRMIEQRLGQTNPVRVPRSEARNQKDISLNQQVKNAAAVLLSSGVDPSEIVLKAGLWKLGDSASQLDYRVEDPLRAALAKNRISLDPRKPNEGKVLLERLAAEMKKLRANRAETREPMEKLLEVARQIWPDDKPLATAEKVGAQTFEIVHAKNFQIIGRFFFIDEEDFLEHKDQFKPYQDLIVICKFQRGLLSGYVDFFYTDHTRLSILLMQAHSDLIAGKVVLDAGSGDAVLTTVASRLGAKKVVGIENNEEWVNKSQELLTLNGIDNAQIIKGDFSDIESIAEVKNVETVLANLKNNGLYEKDNKFRSWHIDLSLQLKPAFYFLLGGMDDGTEALDWIKGFMTGNGWMIVDQRRLPAVRRMPTAYVFQEQAADRAKVGHADDRGPIMIPSMDDLVDVAKELHERGEGIDFVYVDVPAHIWRVPKAAKRNADEFAIWLQIKAEAHNFIFPMEANTIRFNRPRDPNQSYVQLNLTSRAEARARGKKDEGKQRERKRQLSQFSRRNFLIAIGAAGVTAVSSLVYFTRSSHWYDYDPPQTIEGIRKAVELTAEWLRARNYPRMDLIDTYVKKIQTAELADPKMLGRAPFAKIHYPTGEVKVWINVPYAYQEFQKARKTRSDAFFIESFASSIVQEAWGLAAYKVTETFEKQVHKDFEAFKAKVNQIQGQDKKAFENFLLSEKELIQKMLIGQLAPEFFEIRKRMEFLEWAQREELFSLGKVEQVLRDLGNDRDLVNAHLQEKQYYVLQKDPQLQLAFNFATILTTWMDAYSKGGISETSLIFNVYYKLQTIRFEKSQGREGINPSTINFLKQLKLPSSYVYLKAMEEIDDEIFGYINQWSRQLDASRPEVRDNAHRKTIRVEARAKVQTWHETNVTEGINVDQVKRGLRKIRNDLTEINREILDHGEERQIEAGDLEDDIIEQYGEAVKRFNQIILNGPMTARKLEQEFRRFHKALGKKGVVYQAGKYGDEEDEDAIRKIFDDMFQPEFDDLFKRDPLDAAAQVFAELVNQQAFHDGNKRASSLILNYILMKAGYEPFILNKDNVVHYMLIVLPIRESNQLLKSEVKTFLERYVSKRSKRPPTFRAEARSELDPALGVELMPGILVLESAAIHALDEIYPNEWLRNHDFSEISPWEYWRFMESLRQKDPEIYSRMEKTAEGRRRLNRVLQRPRVVIFMNKKSALENLAGVREDLKGYAISIAMEQLAAEDYDFFYTIMSVGYERLGIAEFDEREFYNVVAYLRSVLLAEEGAHFDQIVDQIRTVADQMYGSMTESFERHFGPLPPESESGRSRAEVREDPRAKLRVQIQDLEKKLAGIEQAIGHLIDIRDGFFIHSMAEQMPADEDTDRQMVLLREERQNLQRELLGLNQQLQALDNSHQETDRVEARNIGSRAAMSETASNVDVIETDIEERGVRKHISLALPSDKNRLVLLQVFGERIYLLPSLNKISDAMPYRHATITEDGLSFAVNVLDKMAKENPLKQNLKDYADFFKQAVLAANRPEIRAEARNIKRDEKQASAKALLNPRSEAERAEARSDFSNDQAFVQKILQAMDHNLRTNKGVHWKKRALTFYRKFMARQEYQLPGDSETLDKRLAIGQAFVVSSDNVDSAVTYVIVDREGEFLYAKDYSPEGAPVSSGGIFTDLVRFFELFPPHRTVFLPRLERFDQFALQYRGLDDDSSRRAEARNKTIQSKIPRNGFSDYLKYFRVQKGWSQQQLARAVFGPDHVARRTQTILRWEDSSKPLMNPPSPAHMKRLAEALDVSISELISGLPQEQLMQIPVLWSFSKPKYRKWLGLKLQVLRYEHGYQVTKVAGEIKKYPLMITRWERGDKLPNYKDMSLIAEALDTSVSELLTGMTLEDLLSKKVADRKSKIQRKHFATKIRVLLYTRALTQLEVARKVGVSDLTVSLWSRGRIPSSLEDMKQLAAALEVLPERLLDLDQITFFETYDSIIIQTANEIVKKNSDPNRNAVPVNSEMIAQAIGRNRQFINGRARKDPAVRKSIKRALMSKQTARVLNELRNLRKNQKANLSFVRSEFALRTRIPRSTLDRVVRENPILESEFTQPGLLAQKAEKALEVHRVDEAIKSIETLKQLVRSDHPAVAELEEKLKDTVLFLQIVRLAHHISSKLDPIDHAQNVQTIKKQIKKLDQLEKEYGIAEADRRAYRLTQELASKRSTPAGRRAEVREGRILANLSEHPNLIPIAIRWLELFINFKKEGAQFQDLTPRADLFGLHLEQERVYFTPPMKPEVLLLAKNFHTKGQSGVLHAQENEHPVILEFDEGKNKKNITALYLAVNKERNEFIKLEILVDRGTGWEARDVRREIFGGALESEIVLPVTQTVLRGSLIQGLPLRAEVRGNLINLFDFAPHAVRPSGTLRFAIPPDGFVKAQMFKTVVYLWHKRNGEIVLFEPDEKRARAVELGTRNMRVASRYLTIDHKKIIELEDKGSMDGTSVRLLALDEKKEIVAAISSLRAETRNQNLVQESLTSRRAEQVVRSVRRDHQPVNVFVNAEDFPNLSLAQKNEYLYAALSRDGLKIIVYNERGQVQDKELNTLLKLDRVIRTDKDLNQTLVSFGQPKVPSLHMSKTIFPSQELVRSFKKVAFFKTPSDNGGTLAVALLWASSNSDSPQVWGVSSGPDGFWTVSEDFIVSIQRSYETNLVVQWAA